MYKLMAVHAGHVLSPSETSLCNSGSRVCLDVDDALCFLKVGRGYKAKRPVEMSMFQVSRCRPRSAGRDFPKLYGPTTIGCHRCRAAWVASHCQPESGASLHMPRCDAYSASGCILKGKSGLTVQLWLRRIGLWERLFEMQINSEYSS